jgi:4-amino-4-deoxy-L-arabinose transferase-like glycosyltransferase
VVAYLGVMGFVVGFMFAAVSLDAAEQLLWTQTLRLGYGIQPPLYTWLQWAVFAVGGVNVTALVLTKEILIGLTVLTTYLVAKRISGGDPRIAGLALCSFLFIPQFSYESHRDLTHSVLACTLAAVEIYLLLKLVEGRHLLHYALFGAVAGLGLIAKYNYGLYLLALCLAALSLPDTRQVLWGDRRSWLSVIIATAIFAPHGLWLWTAFDAQMVDDQMTQRLQPVVEDHLLAGIGRGLLRLIKVTAEFFALLIPVYGWAFLVQNCPTPQTANTPRPYASLLGRLLLIEFLLLLASVLIFQVSGFKPRWMQPLLFVVPTYLLLRLRPWINDLSCRRLVVLGGIFGVCTLAILPVRVLWPDLLHGHKRFNTPFAALAQDLRANGFTGGVIVTEDHWMGGNLRLQFPQSLIITPAFALTKGPDPVALLLWQGEEIPPPLAGFLRKVGAEDLLGQWPRTIQLNYHHSQEATVRFSYVVRITPNSGGLL